MEREIICTVCPRGCRVRVTLNGTEVTDVADYGCKRGKEYAAAEATHPVRILTTTVKTDSEKCPLLAVRSSKPIPKEKQMDCMAVIRGIQAKAPVKRYDVLVENICDTGVDIVATGVLK